MNRTLYFLVSLAPCVALAQKPSPQDEQSVADTEFSWCQAFLRSDTEGLADIEREGYTLTNARGEVSSRANDIAEAKTGDPHYTEFSNHETQIRVYGDTAIVTGRTTLAGTSKGAPFQGTFQFTDTLVREGTRWKAVAGQATRVAPTAASALEPLPRDEAWVKRHEGFIDLAKKGGIDLLFLGDSITDNWRQTDRGRPVWDKYYEPLRAANFGIGGDRVQHVLWRIRNGEIDSIKPRVLVLMIGTNNTGLERDRQTPRNRPPEVIAGIEMLVKELTTKLPSTQILLLAVFPRGETASDSARAQLAEINAGIARLDDGTRIHFIDIGHVFLEPDGSISKEIMPDFLHPSTKGYERWVQAMSEPLAKYMK